MSKLPAILDEKTLSDKLEEAIEIEADLEDADGDSMELPENVKKSIQMQNIADTITEHISQVAVKIPEIESTELMFGSGDSGRQTQLYLKPHQDVSKDELRDIGQDLKMLLDGIFPMDFLVGISHKNTVDEDGYPDETDDFHLFLVYKARTVGKPSKPVGESTEIL